MQYAINTALRLPNYRNQLLSLHPHALPSLTSFCGSPRVPRSSPGRPIQSLILIGQDYVTEPDLSQMTRTSVPLRHLDLSAMSVTPTSTECSRNLFMVEVKLALRHTPLSGIASPSFPLRNCVKLDLSNSAEELSLCQSWQSTCPSLRRIVFPSQTEWMLE
ncbi:hypothetical protein J3R83DRAFT_8028 [Lanmaoa asiatica]|nr:hypothetical protein J3R83DRAFT_8028 [Lanmaoa asiatica]